MPNAELPQFQNPDIIGAYLRGRAAPGQQQLQQQQIQAGQMNMDQLKLAMSTAQLRNDAGRQFLGDQGGQAHAQTAELPPGSPVPQDGQDPLAALGDPARLANMAKFGQFNAMMKGEDPIKPITDAYAAHSAAMKDQQERKKFELQPVADQIESVRTAANPEQLVMANASYKQVWDQYAPQLGLNPHDPKDLTADNVRAAATLAHNNIASQSMGGIAPLAMPSSLQTVTTKGGYSYDVDPVTGKKSDIPGQTTPYQRAQLGMEQQRLSMAKDSQTKGGAPPSGYRWKEDGSLEEIPGGPADKAGLGSREGVMFQRVLSSANAGLADLKNIAELPVGASTGLFGIGSSPGHSIFASGRDALRNKLSPQEVQDYNTMVAGLSRNLSTIETAGLAPNGSITASMDSIMLREGDSGITKLRKLAQGRQIIERGLETNLANPKLPQEQKDIVKKILDNVQASIPFTQHEITELQSKQSGNPNVTLQDLATQKGLGKGAAAPYADADKEARYQAWKKDHPNG